MANEELVEQITEEVVKIVDNDQNLETDSNAGEAPDRESTTSPRRVLVILTDGPADLSEVKNQLEQLGEQGVKLELFLDDSLPPEGRRSFRELPNVQEVFEAELPGEGCFSLVTRCDAVLFPTLSLSTLSEVTELDGSGPAGRLAVEALGQDKNVIVPSDTEIASTSDTLQQKFNQKLEEAVNLGLITAPLHEMSYELLQSSVDSGELTEVTVAREKTEEGASPGMAVSKDDDEFSAVMQDEQMRIGTTIGVRDVQQEVAEYIDHTLLNPDATREEIVELCEEARDYGFASVCVNPSWVSLCNQLLQGTEVKVCTVIGFPLGATTTATKVQETREAIANGADEVDMVLNVGALKEGDTDFVRRDVAAVKEAAGNRVLKVILETGLLSESQIAEASKLCKQAGADFVKTSTGFGPGGAKMNDVALMRRVVGGEMGVKASGGVHNFQEAVDMISAGASRIGASAGVSIVSGGDSGEGY